MRLDPADLPGKAVVSADNAHGDFEGHLSVNGHVPSMGGLRSIWVRRPGEPAAHAPHPSAWLTAETRQALFGMLYSASARWMNHPLNADRARLKPWQLRTAHLSGFAVPPTVITTSPRLARAVTAQGGPSCSAEPTVRQPPDRRRAFPRRRSWPESGTPMHLASLNPCP